MKIQSLLNLKIKTELKNKIPILIGETIEEMEDYKKGIEELLNPKGWLILPEEKKKLSRIYEELKKELLKYNEAKNKREKIKITGKIGKSILRKKIKKSVRQAFLKYKNNRFPNKTPKTTKEWIDYFYSENVVLDGLLSDTERDILAKKPLVPEYEEKKISRKSNLLKAEHKLFDREVSFPFFPVSYTTFRRIYQVKCGWRIARRIIEGSYYKNYVYILKKNPKLNISRNIYCINDSDEIELERLANFIKASRNMKKYKIPYQRYRKYKP